MPGPHPGHGGLAVRAAGADQQRRVAGRREPVLDAAQQRQHGRVLGAGHEHADGERALGAQGASHQVRLVGQVSGGLDDPLHGARAEHGLAVRAERARGGGGVHPGPGGDVGQRHARALAHFGDLTDLTWPHRPGPLSLRDSLRIHWVTSLRRMAAVPMISAAAAAAPSTAQSSQNPKLLA